jgi:hypothetical protein
LKRKTQFPVLQRESTVTFSDFSFLAVHTGTQERYLLSKNTISVIKNKLIAFLVNDHIQAHPEEK